MHPKFLFPSFPFLFEESHILKFDSLNGEAFYADKMQEVIDLLKGTGKLVESQGAMVIDLEDKKLIISIINKN